MKLAAKETETENLFETLANESPVGLYIVQDGKFCYINHTFQDTTGYREDELLGKDALGLVVPEDREMVRGNAIKMLKGKLTSPYQFRVTHKNGSIKWIMESVVSIPYRGRQATLGTFLDITDRKQVEEALQVERNKLQSLIDAIEYTITIQDTEYNIIFQNERSKIASDGDHVGEKCYRAYEGRNKVCEGCPVEKAFKDGKSHTAERKTVISGKVAFWENTANPIRDAKGRIVACLEIARDITERKRMEEALQVEKNKLQSVINSMDDGLTIQDTEYNITFQNEPSRITYGDHLGEKCYRVYAFRDKVCPRCPVAMALKDGKSHTVERRQVMPSGKVVFWENTASPIRDAAGKIVACLEIARNITERKQMEEALEAERNKLQSLLDTIEEHITIRDRDYNLIYMAEHAKRLWGDHTGEKCYHVFEGQDKKCEGCPAEKAFSDGKSHTSERKTVTPSGEARLWEVTATPIRDRAGKIVSCLEIARDVTERKKQEQALADEATRRRILIDQSLDGIVVLDEDAAVVEANQRFAEMLGYTPEEVRQLHTWDWDKNFPPEEILEMGRRADEKGFHLETKHTRKDGSVIDVDISINAARFGGQKLIFCVCRDITQRKQMEEALQAERNKLQSLIDAMEDNLTIQDREYNIIFQNEPSKRTTGGDRAGEKCYRVFEGRDKICDGCPVEKAFQDGKSHIAERQRVLPSGELTFWENTANPIRDAQERIVACLEVGRNVTERKKQEQALADEATRRRILFDQSLDGIVVLDVDARVVEANQRFAEMLGYTPEEVRELHTWDWDKNFPPEKLLEMGRNVDEKGFHLETKHTRKDGSVLDVDLSINAAMFGGQKLIFCVCRDITQRKKMEEALNLQRAYFQQLFDNSPDAIVLIDMNNRIIQANRGFEMLFGYPAEEVKGQSIRELLVPEKNAQDASVSLQRIFAGEVIRRESVRRRKDGSLVDVSILGYPIRFNGGFVGAYIIYTDITKRKKAEEALKQAAEEWRNTFDSITDAISIHDRDFRIQRANKAFADMFHMEISQVIGKHCYELHGGNKPISGCPHQQTLTTKKPAAAEFYESHLGKHLLESTSPIFDKQGEVIGTIHVTRDITAQKQQNERLMMADRLASLGELAAGTAHELNNPLTSIIGFSQLLREKDIPEDIREDVEFIYNEAQRAANVTKNLLTFARRHTPVKQLSQINNIIEDVLKLRTYELKVNSIEVKKRLAPNLPEIMVDYFQMQQVFLNIIINAEYFMTEAHKKGTLTITTEKQNGNVVISIADDGPGISEENLRRIFDPFFTTKPAGKGTGLGLSICHGVVTEHGGHIYARSEFGKGATFIIELPINSH